MCCIKLLLIFTVTIYSCSSESNNCGLNDRVSGLLYGGANSTRGTWPWLVALFRVDNNKFFCGSTLLSHRYVLTAAHCMQQKSQSVPTKPSEIVAYLGRHEFSLAYERGSQIGYPERILIHEEWSYTSANYDADIALIFLENTVTFGTYIFPICLGSKIKLDSVTGTVAGWGITSPEGEPSNTPRQADLQIISNEYCFLQDYTLTFVSSNRTFCARGEEGVGPCLGDSGGGFFMKVGRNWFLRGIVSSSLLTKEGTCDVTRNSVFTNIFHFMEWIGDKTGVRVDSPSLPNLPRPTIARPIASKPSTLRPNIQNARPSIPSLAQPVGVFNSIIRPNNCDAGFQFNAYSRTCSDINECEIYKNIRLCAGRCENVPGSYRCTCPEGYKIGDDTKSCEDINECRETPGICRNGNDVCTNLRGSYRCITINCPNGYKKDSDTDSIHRCKRISMLCNHGDYECFRRPTEYSYNFIAMVPNTTVPQQGAEIFNLKISAQSQMVDYELKIDDVQGPPHVEKAKERHFSLKMVQDGVNILLTDQLDGPQDIKLTLTMNVYDANRRPFGSSVANIFLLVSEFPF